MGLIGRVWADIGGDASGLKAATQDAKNSLNSIGKEAAKSTAVSNASFLDMIPSIMAVASSIGAIVSAAKIAAEVFQFSEEGAQLLSLSQASSKLAQNYDANMADIVAATKKASFNTISQYDIMKGANLALTMGITTNATEISQLMQIAIERGRAFGLTTEDAFDRITRGIGRRSTKILDDLGFTANAISANKEYADSLGMSVDALTDDMKVRALFEQILKEGNSELAKQGGLVADISTPYQRLNTIVEEFWNNVKTGAAYTFVPFIASGAELKQINEQAKSYAFLSNSYDSYIKAVSRGVSGYDRRMGIEPSDYLTRGEFAESERWTAQAEAYRKAAEEAQNMVGIFGDIKIELSTSQQTISDSIKDYGDFDSMLEQAWKSSKSLADAINAMPSYKKIIIEIEQRTKSMSAEAARWYGQYYEWQSQQSGSMHGGSFIGMAHGGVVPPGFSNDGMPLWVSSGERVDVTPAGNKSVNSEGAVNKFYGPVTFQLDKSYKMSNLSEQLRA